TGADPTHPFDRVDDDVYPRPGSVSGHVGADEDLRAHVRAGFLVRLVEGEVHRREVRLAHRQPEYAELDRLACEGGQIPARCGERNDLGGWIGGEPRHLRRTDSACRAQDHGGTRRAHSTASKISIARSMNASTGPSP